MLVLYSLAWQSVDAACANSCSGHGTCGQNNICTCFSGWDAGAADCSFRTCPSGPAWADKAYATDKAHLPALCSNAGLCNYQEGKCQCFKGFTGSACQRSVCPNDCSGHGSCVSIADVSYFYGADYTQDGSTLIGDGKGVVYTNWDKDSITMCECDASFFGADCSLHMCAKGDDPLTINQNYRQLRMNVVIASGTQSGDIGFEFQGVTSFVDLDAPTSGSCKAALETSPHIGTVSCTYAQISALRYEFTIIFYSFPTLSRSNNLYNHNGNPQLSDFHCDVSNAGGSPQCTFTDLQTDNIREWAYCSNRGICDFNSGMCSCNKGYGGSACSNSTYFTGITGSNALPGLQVLVDGLDYTGDALQIRSAKSPADDFYLIDAVANNERVFFVRGDGAVGLTSLVTPGGATISSGGLMVTNSGLTIGSGGLTVTDGGASIKSTIGSSQINVANVKAQKTGLSTTFSVLDLNTDTAGLHYMLSVYNSVSEKVFSVKNTGYTEVAQGGLQVTQGGLTVNAGGLDAYGGVTVSSGGLVVDKMGITVTEGAITAEAGIHVKTGGLQVDSGGIKVISAGVEVIAGGLRVNAGVSQIRAGMYVTGGLTVMAGGMRVTGGLTIQNTGLNVAGGVTVAGGITLSDAGITLGATTLTTADNSAYSNGGSQYVLTTSDRRLKERMQTVEASLEKLAKLKGVYYYWTKSAQKKQGYDTRRHLGFLAQDVLEAVPEAVQAVINEKYLAVDYPSIIPLVTAGVNELAEITSALQSESVRLQARILALEEAAAAAAADQAQRKLDESKLRETAFEARLLALQARIEALEKGPVASVAKV